MKLLHNWELILFILAAWKFLSRKRKSKENSRRCVEAGWLATSSDSNQLAPTSMGGWWTHLYVFSCTVVVLCLHADGQPPGKCDHDVTYVSFNVQYVCYAHFVTPACKPRIPRYELVARYVISWSLMAERIRWSINAIRETGDLPTVFNALYIQTLYKIYTYIMNTQCSMNCIVCMQYLCHRYLCICYYTVLLLLW